MATYRDPIITYDNEYVYTPSDDSFLIIDYLKKNLNKKSFDGIPIESIQNVLDMGTGTGIIALFLALAKENIKDFKSKIIASDISENALKCAKLNEKHNNLSNEITFIKSNLFASFPNSYKNSFSVIIFNPPYLPSISNTDYSDNHNNINENNDLTWDGGKQGFNIILKFLNQSKFYIKRSKRSHIYYITSSKTDLDLFYDILDRNGYKNQIIEREHYFFEDIILNRIDSMNF
ncbi:MAG: methyltransferase [Candidatus Lokiarchaeota archaeon]|nr:methyltransferase [Candidatus Lokiarchaeota archaeon]MBD3200168.1 methyltransferase [Candidatus Lokiarchaeota archaeon]